MTTFFSFEKKIFYCTTSAIVKIGSIACKTGGITLYYANSQRRCCQRINTYFTYRTKGHTQTTIFIISSCAVYTIISGMPCASITTYITTITRRSCTISYMRTTCWTIKYLYFLLFLLLSIT